MLPSWVNENEWLDLELDMKVKNKHNVKINI